ncbi:MAG TPA: DUF393 domain-containing protein [Phycisphaerae bacterium]|nr:DUF393 domain-containing protein [Phycisphaerae bacterium]
MTLSTDHSRLQIFFDGACPICSREIAVTRRWDRNHRIEFIDISGKTFDPASHGLDAKRIHEVMHVRGTDGKLYLGVDAFIQIARTLRHRLVPKLFLALLKVPGMMIVARAYYRWFARNRLRLGGRKRCTTETCGI